jgi:RimK family alpha-L-glutamate ligase
VVPYEALVARLGTGRAAAAGGLTADGESLDRADAVLARIIPNGSLEQVIYRVDALHWLEERGVRVVNGPRCIERCVDKFYTSALLQGAGLPTPETVVCERLDAAVEAVRAMGDVIVKPIFGSMGHGMVRVSDPDTAFRVLRALDAVRAVFYVQRVVEHGGRDVRAFVVGGRVLGAIERRAPGGGWRTNVSLGGEPRAIALPPEWERLALGAARAVGADYAGVDLLPGPDGTTYVLEVNGVPGWEGLQRATGLDVAGAVVDELLRRAAGGARDGAGGTA